MRLKSLDIHGFKSFADKTSLDFHEGVTGIVGPNGCGKSNIVDAIRWVLGETSAKALRGGEMADVIFNGTDKRKASAMASVSLNFIDCEEALGVDYNEVSITRRVYKDGKSEYRINSTLCRLRDIHDLFLDTGIGRSAYSIMEQGKIDLLLSSKPEDRRAVFEEAAGISKFKKEKKEALRKLEHTSTNLLRVSDVLEEQERRLNTLQRQVSKARRYKETAADLRTLESHITHQEYRELLAGRNQLTRTIKQLNEEVLSKEKALPTLEASLKAERSLLLNAEKEASLHTRNLSTAQSQIKDSEGQLKLNAERREDHHSRIKRNTSEISDNSQRLHTQEQDLKETLSQIADLQHNKEAQDSSLNEHKNRLHQIKSERLKCENEEKTQERLQLSIERKVASTKGKLESYKANSLNTLERSEALKKDADNVNQGITALKSSIIEQEKKVTQCQVNGKTLEIRKEEAEKNGVILRGDLDTAHTDLREDQSLLSSRTSRLEVLENLLTSGEGLGKGTQAVLSGLHDPARFSPAILGTLVNEISTDDSTITAIEAALSNTLSAIIISDEGLATEIIHHLNTGALGQVELLITPFIKETEELSVQTKPASAIGWAKDLVTARSPEIAQTVSTLLAHTLITPDLETALLLRPTHEGTTFVTLQGEVLSPEGFLKGGKSRNGKGENSSLRIQNEVKALKAEITTRQEEVRKKQDSIQGLTLSVKTANGQIEKVREALQEHQITLNSLTSGLGILKRDLTAQSSRKERITQEQDALLERQRESTEALKKLDQELSSSSELRIKAEEERENLSEKVKTLRLSEDDALNTLGELQTTIAVEQRTYDALQRQTTPLKTRILEIKETNTQREKEIKTYQEQIKDSLKKDHVLTENIDNGHAGVKQSTEKLNTLHEIIRGAREQISTTEHTLTTARRDLLHLTEQRGTEDVEFTKIDLKVENLITTLREKQQIELSTFSPNLTELSITLKKRLQGSTPDSPTPPTSYPDAPHGTDTLAPTTRDIDWASVEELSVSLRLSLDRMGPVNLDAIEEYEELEERHLFIKSQYDDLTSSQEELLNVIDKINKETTLLFSKTFSTVQRNFREMFKELFGEKGKADLVLVDEDDPLESGIDIIAKPPGKKLQSITLLSGGERSMTAVALLFSIYMVKPSPFCVLDELDAPLDESNISRFLNMLEKFIRQSQFIIVTHNKRTMERANVLYGVTMQELGVSRPVGMILSHAQDIVDQEKRNLKSAAAKTDTSQSPAQSAAAQISS